MGKIDIDIFNDILETTKELYANKAKELNEKEFNFRTIERKKLHPNWKIFRKETRKWITLGGVFYLNITMYEVLDHDGKVKRFIYYHNNKLKEVSKCKYDIDNLKLAVKFYLENSKIPSSLKCLLPSKQLLNYYLDKLNVKEQILTRNAELLNNIRSKIRNNDQLFIEMDDFFINHKSTKIKKMRVREVILHTRKKNKLSDVINIFFTKNLDESTTKNNDLNFVQNKINNELSRLSTNREIVVNGDGARWIKLLAGRVNAIYSLDLFHIKKALNDTFGTGKFASKENKMYYNTYINKRLNRPWKNVFDEAIFSKNKTMFDKLWNEFKTNSDTLNVPISISKRTNNFHKLIANNADAIFKIENIFSSYTEHFVYNSFKKHIRKNQSLFCLKHIKMKVIYKNVLKNQATLFY